MTTASFGDGYSQRAPSGLNSVATSINVRWPPMTIGQAQTIDAFLTSKKGVTPFWWTAPGDTAARKWTCGTWTVSPHNVALGIIGEMTAIFREVFDL
ncbi:phage minor tail protein |uniref:Phage minor tail protein \|nr:phage minor tail protein \